VARYEAVEPVITAVPGLTAVGRQWKFNRSSRSKESISHLAGSTWRTTGRDDFYSLVNPGAAQYRFGNARPARHPGSPALLDRHQSSWLDVVSLKGASGAPSPAP
jgi:hypothetical protein